MRALADSGRRTDALRAFQTYRSHLLEEVGTEPSEAIYNLDREIARDHDSSVAGDAMGVFLMSDIVGSTRLWSEHPDVMGSDLAVHDTILMDAISDHSGLVISRAGDSFTGAFRAVRDALGAAVTAERALAGTSWQLDDGIRVRMGIHLGDAQRRGEGWYGVPLNETARMTAVAHGRQIVVSETVVSELVDSPDVTVVDLGEHRLRDFDDVRRIFQVVAPGLATEFPPLRSMGGYVTTLPAQRSPLIGREELVTDIRRRLLSHRLVTLLGPGGVGKTRTAIECAGRELSRFPGGVFFVDLTTATDRADVLAAVVSGVRTAVPPDRDVIEHLALHMSAQPMLLVLDNCEHVVEPAAEIVDTLLTTAPALRTLATSREPLRVYGENRVLMPSLDVNGPTSSGARLFIERAAAADSGSVIDDDGLDVVVEIVRRLDGIPLAIELAAAQVDTAGPEQILEQLDDRFRFLKHGSRHAPPRQQTLGAAVAWSYDLLDADEQRAFRQLAVCAGPFTRRTACGILGTSDGDAGDLLDTLVSKSLVAPVRIGGQNVGYRYLETLREFGRRALADTGESAAALAALEHALLPSASLRDDPTALVNDYICSSDLSVVIEDGTRRAAAVQALEGDRLDAAAFIFSSCIFRDDPGAVETTLPLVSDLAARRSELDPSAWCAVNAAKVELTRLSRRYGECLETAMAMVDAYDEADPARNFFDLWRCALITAVSAEAGLAEIEAVLPRAARVAHVPFDWTLSQLLGNKATGLAVLRRLDEARPVAEQACSRAPRGKESRDQALALLLWISYVTGVPCDAEIQRDVAAQYQELGLAELCAAPGALCSRGSIDDRAAALVASARRRPTDDVPTPYLLAFAWLAVEDGDRARAQELAACSELYDASTLVALLYLLADVCSWSDDAWDAECGAAIARYLGPDHEAAARRGFATLGDEVDRWERRLSHR